MNDQARFKTEIPYPKDKLPNTKIENSPRRISQLLPPLLLHADNDQRDDGSDEQYAKYGHAPVKVSPPSCTVVSDLV